MIIMRQICNWPDSTVCVVATEAPARRIPVSRGEESEGQSEEEGGAAARRRVKISSLTHIKERDFNALRERHRNLRNRMRERARKEKEAEALEAAKSAARTRDREEELTPARSFSRNRNNLLVTDADPRRNSVRSRNREEEEEEEEPSRNSFRNRGALLFLNRQQEEREDDVARLRGRVELSAPVTTARTRKKLEPIGRSQIYRLLLLLLTTNRATDQLAKPIPDRPAV